MRTKVKRDVEREIARRSYRHLPPWAIVAVLPPMAALARGIATSGGIPVAMATSIALVCAVGALTAFTWHVFKPRGSSIRAHATGSVLAAGLWVLWVAVVGLWRTPEVEGWVFWQWIAQAFNWPVWAVWLFAGVIAALTWNIRHAARGDGTDAHGAGLDDLKNMVGVAARLKPAQLEANGTRIRVPATVPAGEGTAKDIASSAGNLAAALRIRQSGVRVEPNPDDHSSADYLIVPQDLLKHPRPWPGPTNPGGSIQDELHLGVYEGGDTAKLWLPGDPIFQPAAGDPISPRNAMHLGTMGMTGSGKTAGTLVLLTDAATRTDVSIVYSDPVKGVQSIGQHARGVGLLLGDRKDAVNATRRLTTVIAHRTHAMGRAGFTQWTPDVFRRIGLKYLIYVWEEAADLLANSELFVKITEQSRSAGISLIPSMQRMSHDRIETSARYNLGGALCFGVGDDKSAGMILSESTMEAFDGSPPVVQWKDRKPGYALLEASGVPESRWPEPLRTYDTRSSEEAMVEALDEWCSDPWLDPITEKAFGQVATDYRELVTAGRAEWQSEPRSTTIFVGGASSAPRVTEENMDEDDTDIPPLPPRPDPDFMPDVDPEEEIEEGEPDPPFTFRSPPGSARATPTAARSLLRQEITKRAQEGQREIHTRELIDFRKVINRSAGWLSGALAELVSEGWLDPAPDRGVYVIVPVDERGARVEVDVDDLADADVPDRADYEA